jgi:transcriptional regulator with XRE-family HTH domain
MKKRNTAGFDDYLAGAVAKDAEARVLFLREFYALPISSQQRVLRSARKLSQVLLGKRANLAQSEIARLEKPSANPRLSTAQAVFRGLGSALKPVTPGMITLAIRQQVVLRGERYFEHLAIGERA